MHVYIGYKNYSSWSLRPWLAMEVAGIAFTETLIPFYSSNELMELAQRFDIPAQVPVLEDNGHIIWYSKKKARQSSLAF